MTTMQLRDPINLGPTTSKLVLLAVEIDFESKRVFLRYTPPSPEGRPTRGQHEQMEILEDAILPIEPPEDKDPDAHAKALEIYREALRDAQSKQAFSDFVNDKRSIVDRAHDHFARRRGLRRA